MSMIKFVRQPLKSIGDFRLFITRFQSHKTLQLLQSKAPIENETDGELENLPIESTIEWNKKLKFFRMRGESKRALKLFEIGIRKYQYQPDYITYVSMIEMCKDIKDLDNGRYIHRQIYQSPVNSNSRIQSLLMEMYIKCRDVHSAREMFDLLKNRTVIEYNTMMTAYNNNNYPQETLDLFQTMRDKAKIKPNNVSYTLYFQACVMLKFFDQGKTMHNELKEKVSSYMKNKELSNQIVSMYLAAKDFSTAEDLFRQCKEPNIPNYVGLMNYFNETNEPTKTFALYEQMKLQRKIQADVSTYIAVLNATKQMKNVDKAKEIQNDLLKQNLWQNHVEIQKLFQEIFQINEH